MGFGSGVAFQYDIRAAERDTDGGSRSALHTEQRDQQLEQYLWAPYNHTCLVTRTGGAGLVGAAATPLNFNADEHDPEGMHDPAVNNTRITTFIEGVWRFNFGLRFDITALGTYYARFQKTDTIGGVTAYPGAGGAYIVADDPELNASRLIPMKAGDYMEIIIDRSAGVTVLGAADQLPYFQAEFVSYIKDSGQQNF